MDRFLLCLAALALGLGTARAQVQPPYTTNFGAGLLDARAWHTESSYGRLDQPNRLPAQPAGRVAVTSQYGPATPAANPFHLVMDDPHADARFNVINAALLHLDLTGAANLSLDMTYRLTTTGAGGWPGALYLSADHGQTYSRVRRFYVGPASSGVYVRYRLALDPPRLGPILPFNDAWVIGFEHISEGTLPGDGFALDSISVAENTYQPFKLPEIPDPRETLDLAVIHCRPGLPFCPDPPPCFDVDCPYQIDFEDRLVDSRLQLLAVNGGAALVEETKAGRYLRLHALEGVGALTVNAAVLPFDFAALARDPDARPTLRFAWRALDKTPMKYDGVYLSDDGGASFVKVAGLGGQAGVWNEAALDLRSLAGRHGLAFTEAFVIAVAHYADGRSGRAGYALDDLAVEGVPGKPSGEASLKASGEAEARTQGGIMLEPNRPNPFNPETTIAFSLPAAQHVRLQVYDLTGRAVATLADEVRPAGRHEVRFAAGRLPSGVYLYRLQAGGEVQTRRLVLVK